MIILGNKYKITKEEKNLLYGKVKDIYFVDMIHTIDDEIIHNLEAYIQKNKVEFIVLNLEKILSIKIKSYLEELDYNGVKIIIFSDFANNLLGRKQVEFNEKNFDTYTSIHHNELQLFGKRLFDFAFSLLALVVLSPLILIISLIIKINAPGGPIFFGHKRIGKDGKFFRVYKFRTMVVNAEEKLQKMLDKNPEIRAEYEKDFKLRDDPRVIPYIGDFMRRSSLDELPQFFNSLIGNMSVVGPRPIVEEEISKYGKYKTKLYSVKPGVTGLWQVSGRNDITYDERVALDMEYIDTYSPIMDIKIIMKTISVMIFRRGAY